MGSFNDYTKEGKDPKSSTDIIVEDPKTPAEPAPLSDKESSKYNWPVIIPATIISLLAFYGIYRNLQPKVKPETPPPVVKVVEPAKPKPQIKYITKWKTKTVTKWKTKYIKSKPQIIYKKDPRFEIRKAELEQHYRRRARLLKEFYEKPLAKGVKRTLTFESDCPKPFDNSQRVYRMD